MFNPGHILFADTNDGTGFNPKMSFLSLSSSLLSLSTVPSQVWFQNHRASMTKRSQKSLHRAVAWAQAPGPGSGQPLHRCGQHGFSESAGKVSHFSWESEGASHQDVCLQLINDLGVCMASPDLQTPAGMPAKSSGDLGPLCFPRVLPSWWCWDSGSSRAPPPWAAPAWETGSCKDRGSSFVPWSQQPG